MSKKKVKAPTLDLIGKFLVASPALQPNEFSKTVILITKHAEGGSIGYCVNRMGKTSVKEVIATSRDEDGKPLEFDCNIQGLIWAGGPCQGPLIMIHDLTEQGDDEVAPGVYVTYSDNKLQCISQNHHENLKVITGYAGWGSKQLEKEIQIGGWLVVDATADEVFSHDEDDLWKRLKNKAGLKIFKTLGIDGSKVNASLN